MTCYSSNIRSRPRPDLRANDRGRHGPYLIHVQIHTCIFSITLSCSARKLDASSSVSPSNVSSGHSSRTFSSKTSRHWNEKKKLGLLFFPFRFIHIAIVPTTFKCDVQMCMWKVKIQCIDYNMIKSTLLIRITFVLLTLRSMSSKGRVPRSCQRSVRLFTKKFSASKSHVTNEYYILWVYDYE